MENRKRKCGECNDCREHKELHTNKLCMKCYNKLRRKVKKYDWAYKHPHCIICKSTKFKHHCKGLCVKCRLQHDDIYKANQIRAGQNKARINKKRAYRKRADVLERNRERIKKYHKENPHKKIIRKAFLGNNTNIEEQLEALDKEIKNERKKL